MPCPRMININELQRKYGKVEQEGDKTSIYLNSILHGDNYYEQDGIKYIKPEFIQEMMLDVIKAKGDELEQDRYGVQVLENNGLIVEIIKE